ncbi:DegV family protein [Neobacillus sp. D3-1R]|uniref:DegV family protein n=1 Tax=Neobacillus sp. D3-1R TaxID=3445778 RepID=UPI003F9FD4B2
MIKIITDSSVDLPKEILEKYNITLIPLKINMNNQDYLEGVDLTPEEFFTMMFSSDELPKTSQPAPASFAKAFSQYKNEYEEILCLTISSGLSGTYQSACIGKDLSDAKVTVFDTLAGSQAHGILAIRAAELAHKGHTMEEIVSNLTEYRGKMNILVLLDTLENIVKGGRLSRFQGSIAKILNIKVILEADNGKVEIREKIRGKKKFHKRVLEIIEERGSDFSNISFGITYTGNTEEAEALKQEIIEQFHPKEVLIHYMEQPWVLMLEEME